MPCLRFANSWPLLVVLVAATLTVQASPAKYPKRLVNGRMVDGVGVERGVGVGDGVGVDLGDGDGDGAAVGLGVERRGVVEDGLGVVGKPVVVGYAGEVPAGPDAEIDRPSIILSPAGSHGEKHNARRQPACGFSTKNAVSRKIRHDGARGFLAWIAPGSRTAPVGRLTSRCRRRGRVSGRSPLLDAVVFKRP